MSDDQIRCGKCGEPCDHVCGNERRFVEMRKALADLFDTIDACAKCRARGSCVAATHKHIVPYEYDIPLCDDCARPLRLAEQAETMATVAAGDTVRRAPDGSPDNERTRELPHAQLIRDIADLLDRTEPEET